MNDTIFLQYYSRLNFGDDLFVRVFAEHFPDYKICLLGNPAYIPKKLGSNVYVSPFSWATVAAGVLQTRIKGQSQKQKLQQFCDWCVSHAQKGAAASVMIGGSIFMDTKNGREEIRFDVNETLERDFSYRSSIQPDCTKFVIGANLGPAYSDAYFQTMIQRVKSYAHICFRDYASYYRLKDSPNVQYAPDVVFAMEPIRRASVEKKVVISVIDPARHTKDQQIAEQYYSILAETIDRLVKSEHQVVLVSFCKREGDEIAIENLRKRCQDCSQIEVYRYSGNLDGMIECFATASFVIASRFHSMILAAVCAKPMFPIAYNCKTTHYLQDLRFSGSSASFDTLSELQVSDVLRNYENGYICDCGVHHWYAENQFLALKKFLIGDE